MKICFFAKVESHDILETVGFYADDVRILRELGHDVTKAINFAEIPWDADVYYVWWWSWALLPLLKAKLKGKPVVICGVFDYDVPPRGVRVSYLDRPWWQQLMQRTNLRFADVNIFVSEFEIRQISSLFKVQNPKMIPCAVDSHKFTVGNDPKQPFILNIAWSGKYNAIRKCLPQIIEAFARVSAKFPEVRLKMAGRQGEYHEHLVKLANDLGISDRIDFMGVIAEDLKIKLMQTCTVYMQPSLFEGFGLATAEAMACGAAIISSPAGAVAEVVGDAGMLVDGKNVDAIAQSLERLLSDQTLNAALGAKARAQVSQLFSFERRKRELSAVIDSVTRNKNVNISDRVR
jgi:glycosyltransferase involved in cell wall biosynthesis